MWVSKVISNYWTVTVTRSVGGYMRRNWERQTAWRDGNLKGRRVQIRTFLARLDTRVFAYATMVKGSVEFSIPSDDHVRVTMETMGGRDRPIAGIEGSRGEV